MHTLLLLAGLRPWRATSSTAMLTRVLVAVSVLSVEAQIVTMFGLGTIASALPVTVVVAVAAFTLWGPETRAGLARVRPLEAVPLLAVALLAIVVLTLNVSRPVEAADPYHLDKVERIVRTGTLNYDVATDTKINILNSTYELVLADLRSVPVVGAWLVRLHGVLGLLLYLIALASTRELLEARTTRASARPAPWGGPGWPLLGTADAWPWALLLVVPVVFHQFVLLKNDLFVGALTLVVLAWTLTRADSAAPSEIVWAAWLTGTAVTVKLTTLPLAVIVVLVLAMRHRNRALAVGAAAVGGVMGALTGGLLFTLVENLQVYGSLMPTESLGNRPHGLAEIGMDVQRFAISLVDLGQLTRRWWPGRGGWGGTFGLPLIWGAAVLITHARASQDARRTLLYAGTHFLIFAAAFPDGDVAQRLALGPGLFIMAMAVHLLNERGHSANWLRLATWPVGLLSCAQIARSTLLYLRS